MDSERLMDKERKAPVRKKTHSSDRIRLTVVAAVVLGMLVAACGGETGNTITSSGEDITSTSAGDTTTTSAVATTAGTALTGALEDAPPDDADLAAPVPFDEYCSETLTVEEALDFPVPDAASDANLVHMLISLQGHYFLSSAWGAQEAAEEAGVELDTLAAEGYASPDLQQQQLGDISQRDVDAVILLPADVNGSVPLVDQARDAGIQLVVEGSLLNSNQIPQSVQSDYGLGQLAADLVAEALDETGQSGGSGLIMAGPMQATWAANRLAGFTAQVEDQYPNIEIAVVTHQNFVDPTEGLNTFTDAIQANPDLDWIYSVDYNLLEAPSLPGQYKGVIPYIAMGLYGTSEAALRDGTVDVIIGLMPALGSRIGVARAVSMLNGETVPAITCYPAPIYTADTLDQPSVVWEGYPEGFQP